MAVATAALLLLFVAAPAASAADAPAPGDTAYVGEPIYVNGSAFMFPIYATPPADPDAPGEPDFWAYCIEHDIDYEQNRTVQLGDLDSFLGSNLFSSDAQVPGQVLWILAHSYPALTLDDLAAEAGVPGLTQAAAIEATTTAIWRFTDLGFDAPWNWEENGAEELYNYLVDGAKNNDGLRPSDFTATVTVTGPSEPQIADSLIGPFTVHTDQPTASVTSTPALPIVDDGGNAIDADAVTDGQEVYLDARGTASSGSATVTAAVAGSSATGLVGSVPTDSGDAPTAGDHAQSFMVVAPAGTRTIARVTADWEAPNIQTDLSDAADGDKNMAATGGTAIDTVHYENLVPGGNYTLTGELIDKATGEPTSITGSTTFTASDSGSGTAQVTFTIPAKWAGHTLVAFETLHHDELLVAEHHDINDAAQTIVLEAASGTTTSTSTRTSAEQSSSSIPDESTATVAESSNPSSASTVPSTTPAGPSTDTSSAEPALAETGVSTTTWTMAAGALLMICLGVGMTLNGRRRTHLH